MTRGGGSAVRPEAGSGSSWRPNPRYGPKTSGGAVLWGCVQISGCVVGRYKKGGGLSPPSCGCFPAATSLKRSDVVDARVVGACRLTTSSGHLPYPDTPCTSSFPSASAPTRPGLPPHRLKVAAAQARARAQALPAPAAVLTPVSWRGRTHRGRPTCGPAAAARAPTGGALSPRPSTCWTATTWVPERRAPISLSPPPPPNPHQCGTLQPKMCSFTCSWFAPSSKLHLLAR